MSPPSCSVGAGASPGKRKSRAPVRAKRRCSPVTPTHAQATEPATKLGPPRYRSWVWAQETEACADKKDHRVRLAARVFPVKRREPPLGCVQPSTMMRYFELAQNFAGSAIFTAFPEILPSWSGGVSSADVSCRDTIRYSLSDAGSGSSVK